MKKTGDTFLDKLLERVKSIAGSACYNVEVNKNNPYAIRCLRNLDGHAELVIVYWNALTPLTGLYTVGTTINHPKRGRTQLHRRDITWSTLVGILHYPRKHTGKGYYKK